jgi:hypothetical protein
MERDVGYEIVKLDQAERASQKQTSRDEDARQLAAGEITPEELRKRNSFFGSLDFSRYQIVSIGGKPLNFPEMVRKPK